MRNRIWVRIRVKVKKVGSGSASKWKEGSGSASKLCRSAARTILSLLRKSGLKSISSFRIQARWNVWRSRMDSLSCSSRRRSRFSWLAGMVRITSRVPGTVILVLLSCSALLWIRAFLYWSVSANPWLWSMDPIPETALFVLDLKIPRKSNFFPPKFSCLVLFEGTFT